MTVPGRRTVPLMMKHLLAVNKILQAMKMKAAVLGMLAARHCCYCRCLPSRVNPLLRCCLLMESLTYQT
jgi:hypothetical protein